jgi:hypothetical protein
MGSAAMSAANDTRGLFDTAFTQTDNGIPVASQTSAIENIKDQRSKVVASCWSLLVAPSPST